MMFSKNMAVLRVFLAMSSCVLAVKGMGFVMYIVQQGRGSAGGLLGVVQLLHGLERDGDDVQQVHDSGVYLGRSSTQSIILKMCLGTKC